MLTDADIVSMETTFLGERSFSPMGEMGLRLITELRRLRKEIRDAEVKGIWLAASVAQDYDKSSLHPYLVSDCILGKLNVRNAKPRRNPSARSIDQVIRHIERKVSSIEATTTFMAAMAREIKPVKLGPLHTQVETLFEKRRRQGGGRKG